MTNYHTALAYSFPHTYSPLTTLPCVGQCHCSNENCLVSLQQEYDLIIHSLKEVDSILPRRNNTGSEKNWWSNELSDLKQQSIEIQRLWVAEGRPGQGPTHHERLRVRANYKRAIRHAQREPAQISWNQLHSALEDCDSNKFWHSWKSLNNKNKRSTKKNVYFCTISTHVKVISSNSSDTLVFPLQPKSS